MDLVEPLHSGSFEIERSGKDCSTEPKPRTLPDDLPKSLDDRRSVPTFRAETEMYDAWQGPQYTTPLVKLSLPPFCYSPIQRDSALQHVGCLEG